MKTAISLPDEIFERVTRRASLLGLSRSEFFARAAQRYLDDLDAQNTTQQINEALVGLDDSASDAVDHGRRALGTGDDW